MELLQLRYFQTVATLGNMSKAAEELFVSQPNLSISISHLESELGVSLFDRRKGRIVLNQNGEQFLRCVNRALSILDSGISDIRRESESKPTLSMAFMTEDRVLLKSFVLAHPEINIQFKSMELHELTQAILDQTIDIAWTAIPPVDDRLNCLVAYESEFVVIMSEDHPLAKQTAVTFRDLEHEQFAIDPAHVHPGRFITGCNKKGLSPTISHNVRNLDLVLSLVQSGHCVSSLPELGYETLVLQGQCDGIVRRRFVDSAPVASYCIVWNKSVPLKKAGRLFRDFIFQHFNDIIRRFREMPGSDPL